MERVATITNNVAIFLLNQISEEKSIAESFFSDPYSCLVIFRLLPEISKNIILRGLNSNEKGELDYFYLMNKDFFLNTKANEIGEYVAGLTQLRILEKIDAKNAKNFKINEIFFKTMKKVLNEGLITDKKKFHRKAKGYGKYLEKGMNRFYKFINEKVFDQFDKFGQDNEINNFLIYANFLRKDEDKKYQMESLTTFLNKTEELIILFFFKYLKFNIENKILSEKKFIFFRLLFYLSTLEPGSYFTEFPKEYYDPSLDKHLDFMNQTGFLITKTETKNSLVIKKYICTPLIQALFENNNISEDFALIKYGDENAFRFLYVETNMKFYAFMPTAKNKVIKERQTSIQLNLSENFSSTMSFDKERESKDEKIIFYINLLKSMFRIEMILPENGLIGYITRENLKKIFKYLSNSTRLLQFLSDHMSLNYDDVTVVNGKKYLINESVVNQILVLESEKKSFHFIKSVTCYYAFYDKADYRKYLDLMKHENIKIIEAKETLKNNMIIVIDSNDERKIKNKYNL